MEEIDIIELLIRERQDKAPKRIEINGKVYIHTLYSSPLGIMYVEENNMSAFWKLNGYTIDTKIKILDKPIIPELPKINQNEYDTNSSYRALVAYENRYVINTIIRHINKEEK